MRSRNYPSFPRLSTTLSLVIVSLCLFIGQQAIAMAMCPFCSAVALTFTEQINEQQVAIVAKLIETPEPPTTDSYDFPDGKFEIVGVLKGDDVVTTGMTFKTQLVGVYPVGQKFLVMGQGAPDITWTTPVKASERVFEYLSEIRKLPKSGPERLVFFQKYFEDKEKILAFDAYDEFAAAPYLELEAMKDQMQREKLLEYIQSPKTTVNRRRLYFTLLGVCGQPEDAKMLEGLIRSDSRKQQAGLDALVGCYLKLVGKKGLPLIVEKFLDNDDADYVDLTNVMEALRFITTETDVLSTDDIVPAVRTILDHPKHSDIVIEDLARWGDWSVMDKLVKQFKEVDEESTWQRVPIIAYLLECPKPEAAEYLKELKAIDPQAFERASFFRNIGDVDDDDDWGDEEPETDSPPAEIDEPVESNDKDANEGDDTDKGDDKNTPAPEPAIEVSVDQSKPTVFRDDNVQAASHLADEPKRVADPEPPRTFTVAPKPATVTPARPLPKNRSINSASRDVRTGSVAAPTRNRPTQVAAASSLASSQQDSAEGSTSVSLVLKVIFIPLAASFLILGLMWSVVNGWFERLIF